MSPEDLPGPIQEGVVVIGAVHLTQPDLDYSRIQATFGLPICALAGSFTQP